MTKQVDDHHPTAWYWEMKAQEKNAFWASMGGWTLDAMDVQIFTFAVPALIAALKDPDWAVRFTAALALGSIGPQAAAALPALCDAVKDSSPAVSEAAAASLIRIKSIAE